MKYLAAACVAFGLICLSACGRQISDADFIRCWGGQLQDRTAHIRFKAIVYPRESVISSSERCPDLRMRMDFYEESTPDWFPIFDVDENRPFEPIAIEGEGFVRIKSRDAERMIVTVERLTSGRIMSEDERRRLILKQN